MDALENYFTYDVRDDFLNIYFTSQYSRQLLKSEKINQLACMITNDEILRMFNSVGEELWSKGEIKFDSLFNKLNLIVRLEKREKCIQVVEILAVKKKKINAQEINIYHPSLEESISSNEAKKRKYVGKSNAGEVEIDSTVSGASQAFDEVNTSMEHEYVRIPRINKLKTGRKARRDKEDSRTKEYLIDKGNLRAVADEGGQDLIKGLEFSSIENISVKGELEEFIEVLKLLEKEPAIGRVDTIVGDLPGDRTFSKLNDGITKRRYAIGKVTMVDGRECSLIEVEREDRALSMLILKGNKLVKWKSIYSILLLGLVEKSGKWSSEDIIKIQRQGIIVIRKKHIKKIDEIERKIYNNF
ncbi:MAG: Tn7-like element transposition protein TnsE [Clostridium sp.]